MTTSVETLSATNRGLFETSLDVARTLFDSVERLTALNLNTARSFFSDATGAVRAALAARSPQEFIAVQTSIARPAADKVLGYYRSAYEIAAQTLEEAMKPFEIQLSAAHRSFGQALENAAKSAPAGSEVALAAVRSALATASSAYGQVNKAARQAVEMAEANVANATAATAAIGAAANRKSGI
ncbi:phasin family protein [Aromatoleum sp.]|uniref:phasin family protein n=1 Tax=Aromatoleum sp. TaxID=2307007 RepID=UPI002FCA3492